MGITLKIRPLDSKFKTSVYRITSRRNGKLRNGEKVCLGKPVEKEGQFNYAVYKVNDSNAIVDNLGSINTDRGDLSGEENQSQKLNALDETVWNNLNTPVQKVPVQADAKPEASSETIPDAPVAIKDASEDLDTKEVASEDPDAIKDASEETASKEVVPEETDSREDEMPEEPTPAPTPAPKRKTRRPRHPDNTTKKNIPVFT